MTQAESPQTPCFREPTRACRRNCKLKPIADFISNESRATVGTFQELEKDAKNGDLQARDVIEDAKREGNKIAAQLAPKIGDCALLN